MWSAERKLPLWLRQRDASRGSTCARQSFRHATLRWLRQWRSIEDVRFIETSVFTRRITDVLSDDDYRLLQQALLRRPAQGDRIEGTGGVRKLRWSEEGRGKRGGLRLIYYWHAEREIFLMLFLYRKSEQKDLTAEQKRILAKVVQQEFK
jgi:Protein of unknown function (DUF1044).